MDWQSFLKNTPEGAGKSRTKKLFLVFKILVSVGFVLLLCRTISLGEVLKLFASLHLAYALMLFFLAYLMIVVSCIKWRILLRRKGIDARLHSLVRLYILGNFFNNFLPGMVGGDSVRGLILGRRFGRLTDVFLSIFMERFTGFLALIFLAAGTVAFDHPLVHVGNLRSMVALILVGALGLIVLVFSRSLFSRLLAILPTRLAKLRAKLDMLHVSLLEFSEHKGDFAVILLLSLAFHLITGVNLYYACLALNYEPDLLAMIVVTPFILLMSMLPVSINGIGLWESSFVLFFSLLGIPSSLALSAALLLRLRSLIVSALGGVFYLQGEKPTVSANPLPGKTAD